MPFAASTHAAEHARDRIRGKRRQGWPTVRKPERPRFAQRQQGRRGVSITYLAESTTAASWDLDAQGASSQCRGRRR